MVNPFWLTSLKGNQKETLAILGPTHARIPRRAPLKIALKLLWFVSKNNENRGHRRSQKTGHGVQLLVNKQKGGVLSSSIPTVLHDHFDNITPPKGNLLGGLPRKVERLGGEGSKAPRDYPHTYNIEPGAGSWFGPFSRGDRLIPL